MAKKIYEFDLETDRELIKMYDAAEGSYLALWEFLHNIRREVLKTEEDHSEEYINGFRRAIHEIEWLLEEKGVIIE